MEGTKQDHKNAAKLHLPPSTCKQMRLFLGGLPWWVTHEGIKQWCWEHSRLYPFGCQIVRKGKDHTMVVAFVTYKSRYDAQQALRLLPRHYDGYRLTVSEAHAPRTEQPPRTSQPSRPQPPAPVVPATRDAPPAPGNQSSQQQ